MMRFILLLVVIITSFKCLAAKTISINNIGVTNNINGYNKKYISNG